MKFRSLLLWTLAVLIVLILVGIAAIKLLFPPQKVVASLVPRLEAVLNRPVEYRDVNLKLFPGVAISIEDLQVKNGAGFVRSDFLRIEQLECRLRIWPLLRGQIEIAQVAVVAPELYLIKNKDGFTNYRSDRDEVGAAAEEPALWELLAFDRVTVSRGRVIHRDDSTSLKWVVGNINYRSVTEDRGELKLTGSLEVDSLTLHSDQSDFIVYPAELLAEIAITYFPDSDSLVVDECELSLGDLVARIYGRIANPRDSTYVDISLIAPRLDLDGLEGSPWLTAFPPLRDLRLGGQLRLDATYRGLLDDPETERLRGKLTLTDVTVSSPRLDGDFEAGLAELNFNSQSLSFFTEDASIGDIPASFRVAFDNFDDPNLSAELEFTSSLGLVSQVLQLDPDSRLLGVAAVSLSGFTRWADRENLRLLGTVDLSDVSFDAPYLLTPVQKLESSCQFLGKDVQLRSFHLESGETVLDLQGRLKDFSAYLATLGRSVKKPLLDFSLAGEAFDFDAMLGRGLSVAGTSSDSALFPLLALWPDFDAAGSIAFEKVFFDELEARDFRSRFLSLNRILQLDSIHCSIFGGAAEGEIVADLSDSLLTDWELECRADNIRVEDFLSDIVGLTDQLSGSADMLAQFEGVPGSDAASNLRGTGSVIIADGELRDLPPMLLLAERLGVASWRKLRFRDLRCRFEIDGGFIYFDDVSFSHRETESRISGRIGLAGELDFQVETTLSSSDAKTSLLPKQARDQLKVWDGAELMMHVGGTSAEPTIEIEKLRPRKDGNETDAELIRKLFNDLLES